MSASFLERAQELQPELVTLWQSFHRCPELGNREVRTAERLEAELRALGLETERVLSTGIVATLRGGREGKCVALRSDMDALPITEDTLAAFASSNPGVMHACGHDFHMTAALGAARLLSERRAELPGTVRFLFQPDEEGNGGAARMIAAGCLEGVSAVFGAHVSPELPTGVVGVRYGKFYAASDMFTVTVRGKSCHAATPEKGIDALAAAAEMVCALSGLRRELCEEFGPTVISVGSLHAGTVGNVIADTAVFQGIIRTLGPECRAEAVRRFRALVECIAARRVAAAEIDHRESYPGVVNNDAMTRFAETAALRTLGPARVTRIGSPTMTTEDFGYFLQKVPGSFYHIGVGGTEPLHSSRFLSDPAALPIAAAVHSRVLFDYLSEII